MKDAIRYKVTVTALVQRVETAGKDWAKTTAAADAPYAYTPEILKTVERAWCRYWNRAWTTGTCAPWWPCSTTCRCR